MTAGAMIVADGTTSQGELTRPLEKLGSVSVAQRMVDTFRHAGCGPHCACFSAGKQTGA